MRSLWHSLTSMSYQGGLGVRLGQAAVVLLVPTRRHQDRLEVVGVQLLQKAVLD